MVKVCDISRTTHEGAVARRGVSTRLESRRWSEAYKRVRQKHPVAQLVKPLE